MTQRILKRILSVLLLMSFTVLSAQDADPIETARQAKLAAEKAAANAEAATGAAIEAAASKAAAKARVDIIAGREAEKARKIAEKAAAEDAEIDKAAEAAAIVARRKLALELGLEIEEVPDSSVSAEVQTSDEMDNEKTSNGWTIGAAPSVGFLSGESFTSVPFGATAVITSPFTLNLGPLVYTVSFAIGAYAGEYDTEKDENLSEELLSTDGFTHSVDKFTPVVAAVGGNITLFDLLFAEGHVGLVGRGPGIRGFTGISLERLLKKSLNLPFNLKLGSELFISNDLAGYGNPSGWVSLGLKLDYSL